MQLTYRNAQYQPKNIGQATTPTGETGMYRGAKVQFRAPSQVPARTGFNVLTYRNAQYRSPCYHLSSQAPVTESVDSFQRLDKVPALGAQ